MRELLTFRCESMLCAASLDRADGDTAVLLVSGGYEGRAGAHGWQAALAGQLAEAGFPVLRFDRRGVADSEGERGDFRTSGPDLAAAAALLRREQPGATRIIGVGNCDAASALALFGTAAGVSGLVLLNPWTGDDHGDLPPAAAIRSRYRERLGDPRAWLRLLSGGVNLRALMRGLAKLIRRPSADGVAAEMADALQPASARLILSAGDATAIAFREAWAQSNGPVLQSVTIPTRSHSFAEPGDADRLAAACLEAIAGLEADQQGGRGT